MPEVPAYVFREEESFTLAQAQLDLPADVVDEQVWAIQDAIVNDPVAGPWSVPLQSRPGIRVAVSSEVDHAGFALRVLFRVEGNVIKLLHVERR
jgi:hypothetical protein